jgi:mono/diheme cytochrome c family protein
MNTNYFKMLAAFFLIVFSIGLMSLTLKQDPWVVPDKYKTMKNPVKADNTSINDGKALYVKNCLSCHGKTGLGDGAKAKTLETGTGDMSGSAYQSQTDGEHFYKTKFGRGDMPKYDKKIPDEDVWAIVNYIRTFKK